jgi:hypothetical protein
MQHGDLDKTKVLKTQRDSKSDCYKETKFQECARPILHTGQIGWTYPRASSVHRTCPVPLPDSRDIYWTCPILDQLSLMNNMTVGI